jgi:hypothetical protein
MRTLTECPFLMLVTTILAPSGKQLDAAAILCGENFSPLVVLCPVKLRPYHDARVIVSRVFCSVWGAMAGGGGGNGCAIGTGGS